MIAVSIMKKIVNYTKYWVYGQKLYLLSQKKMVNSRFDNSETLKLIKCEDLGIVERSRPGYSKMALKYLNNKDIGICVMVEDLIVAMGWSSVNNSSKLVYSSYFPLQPGTAWFHSDWTSERFRGNGYHKALIRARIEEVLMRYGIDINVLTNILPTNEVSVSNYEKMGFLRIGYLQVIDFLGRRNIVWPKNWDL